MASESIISAIDAEIATLQQVRELLANGAGLAGVRRRGRPKKAAAKKAVKRSMSPEARQRIADAQRKRWAAVKGTKSSARATVTKKAAKKAAKRVAPKKASKAVPAVAVPETPKVEAVS